MKQIPKNEAVLKGCYFFTIATLTGAYHREDGPQSRNWHLKTPRPRWILYGEQYR